MKSQHIVTKMVRRSVSLNRAPSQFSPTKVPFSRQIQQFASVYVAAAIAWQTYSDPWRFAMVPGMKTW